MIDIYATSAMVTIDSAQCPEILCTVTGETTETELVGGELVSVTKPVYAPPTLTWEPLYNDGETSLIRIWTASADDEICRHPSVLAHGIESLMLHYPEHAKRLIDVVYVDTASGRRVQVSGPDYDKSFGVPVETRLKYALVGAYKSPSLRPQITVLDDDDIVAIEASRKTKAEAIKIG